MPNENTDGILVEINVLHILLSNLYAVVINQAGVSHEGLSPLAEALAGDAMGPAIFHGPEPDPERFAAMQELASLRIAQFFVDVQERLRGKPT